MQSKENIKIKNVNHIKERRYKEEMKGKNKKGVSLIVLVITIIVMIILAGAVIISLTNSGIIGKANEAVAESNLKQVQQVAQLAWSEAYIAKMENSGIDLKQEVLKSLAENEIDTTKYNIEVTENGVTVTLKTGDIVTETGWRIERTTNEDGLITKAVVTDGTVEYEIGTTVNYMPEGVGPTDAKYTGGWKLLGVDDEGRLLIMSNDSITGSNVTLSGEEGFLTGLTTLQNTVNSYKDGTIGVDVRSVTAEDIDAVTGYDKTTFTGAEYLQAMVTMYKSMGITGTDAEIKAKLLSQFGFESEDEMALMDNGLSITYSWDGTEFPKYTYVKNSTTKSGNLLKSHSNGFKYYDAATNSFKTVVYTTTAGDIATITNDNYGYLGNQILEDTSKAYKMLFLTADESTNASYWLASRLVNVVPSNVYFGMRVVIDGSVYGADLVYSFGVISSSEYAARAVVTLASGIQLADSDVAGTYDIITAE